MSRTRTEGSSTVFPAAWHDDFWVGSGPRASISGVGTGSQALRDSAFDAHTRLHGLLLYPLVAAQIVASPGTFPVRQPTTSCMFGAGTREPDSFANEKSFSLSPA
jgi:hypothetical protein